MSPSPFFVRAMKCEPSALPRAIPPMVSLTRPLIISLETLRSQMSKLLL